MGPTRGFPPAPDLNTWWGSRVTFSGIKMKDFVKRKGVTFKYECHPVEKFESRISTVKKKSSINNNYIRYSPAPISGFLDSEDRLRGVKATPRSQF